MFIQNSFKLASRSFKASSTNLSPSFWKSSPLRRSIASKLIASVPKVTVGRQSATLGLLIGAASTIAIHSHSKILNEVGSLGTINVNSNVKDYTRLAEQPKSKVTSRFGGKLHYKQLSYGSLTGLFFGVVIGKLSSVLVFISLSTFLLIQFLQSRDIIHVPWTSVIKVGADRIDVRQLVLEDPSFKISFALSFLIAAFNI